MPGEKGLVAVVELMADARVQQPPLAGPRRRLIDEHGLRETGSVANGAVVGL